jgi:hypothetical protein
MHGYSVPESDDASVLRGHPAAAWPLCLGLFLPTSSRYP